MIGDNANGPNDVSVAHALHLSDRKRTQFDHRLAACAADVYVRRAVLAWREQNHDAEAVHAELRWHVIN